VAARHLTVSALTAAVLACGGDGGNGPSQPTIGSLRIITNTRGSSTDPNGYVITIDGVDRQAIGNNSAAVLDGLALGTYLLGLGEVAENCQVQGSNPRTVSILGGETTVAFSLSCTGTTLVVTTATSGSGVDPDGYTLSIDGGAARKIGVDSSVTLSGVPGPHSVQLSDLAAVCAIQGTNPVTITLEFGKTAEVGFTVACDGTWRPSSDGQALRGRPGWPAGG
jgi:hypothetical protein